MINEYVNCCSRIHLSCIRMIVGVGIDLIEISRIRDVYTRHGDRFTNRVFTEAEKAYILQHAEPGARLAGRWAAKEAALKALGTGLAEGISWREVEILSDERGKPKLHFHGKAAARAKELEARTFHVSITHSNDLAMAQVILER